MTDPQEPRVAGRFGKLAAKSDSRTLRFGALLAPDLQPPPDHYNLLPRAEKGAGQSNPTQLFPMLGNDRVGDCTIAAAAHAETVWNAFCGKRRKPSKSAVLNEYYGLTGGDDTGLVMLDVCNHWRQVGVTGEKILAFAGVDRRDHDMVKRAISMFGGLYLGFQVQVGAVERFNRRQIWVPDTLTNDGHCVWAYAYDANTIAVLTWGSTQRGTWDWFDECADESFAIIPGEATLAAFEPGLNLAQLEAELAAVTA